MDPLIHQFHTLELRIKSSNNNDLNPIADLVENLQSLTTQLSHLPLKPIHALVYALHRIFASLIRQGRLHALPPTATSDDPLKLVSHWLKKQYAAFIDGLLDLFHHQSLGLDCITIIMSLVRSEAEVLNTLKIKSYDPHSPTPFKYPPAGFRSPTFTKLVKKLLGTDPEPEPQITRPVARNVEAEFITRYFNYCDDVRYHFLKEAASLCRALIPPENQPIPSSTCPPSYLIGNLLTYLGSLTTMPTKPEQLSQFWAGKPITVSNEKKRRRSNPARKSSKKIKVDADGSTGIFDDSTDSDSDHDPAADSVTKSSSIHPLLCLRSHRKAFSECWINFLGLRMNESEVKRVLKLLPCQVIPHMIDPKILMDFLVDCIDVGGSIAILSLHALFLLMTKHNLDYPGFYPRLYSLLDRNTLHGRHRPKFFRMLEIFLSSTHLPVSIVASFIKRLARLSLFAPPGATVTVIAICYNLMKKHPSCMVMLQSPPTTDTKRISSGSVADDSQQEGKNDPFEFDQQDPLRSGALSLSPSSTSSHSAASLLWELASLRAHYLSSCVGTLSKVFEEKFDMPEYSMEDFLDHGYASLLRTEFGRLIRKPPALSIFATTFTAQLGSGGDVQGGGSGSGEGGESGSGQGTSAQIRPFVPDDIVTQMWGI